MIHELYAVFDQKALTYSQLIMFHNEATAIREFQSMANDPNQKIGRNPEDYVLSKIGDFNDVSGILTPLSEPHTVGKAIQFVNRLNNLQD